MANERDERESALLRALEAAGTAVAESAKYGMKLVGSPTVEVGITPPKAPLASVSAPTDPFDTRQWHDDANTASQADHYYLHFKPGGAGNPAGEGPRNRDLARLYAFLFTQKAPGTAEPNHDLWIRWQRRIHNELSPLLAATPPNAEAVQRLVTEINGWLARQIDAHGDPEFQNLTVNLTVAQYVVLNHALVAEREYKLLSPWGGTLEREPKMFW